MRASDIVHEVGNYWVYRDHKQKAYHVMRIGTTHSTSDSSYELSDDGFSIAKARCNYLAKREEEKQTK